MEHSPNIDTAPMRLHGRALIEYSIGHIDDVLREIEYEREHSVGKMMMKGWLDATGAMEVLDAYAECSKRL